MVLKVLALTLLTEHHNEQTSSNMRRLVKRHVTSITSTKTKQKKRCQLTQLQRNTLCYQQAGEAFQINLYRR